MFQSSTSHRRSGNAGRVALATWNVTRWFVLSAGMLLVLWSCNSHSFSGLSPMVTNIPAPDGGATGTTSAATTPVNPFGGTTSTPFGGIVAAGGDTTPTGGDTTPTGGNTIVPFGGTTTASSGPSGGQPSYDAAVPPPVPDALIVEPYSCPPGTVRIHVRDIWSSAVTPTMNTMTTAPLSVLIINPTGSWPSYGARQDTGN